MKIKNSLIILTALAAVSLTANGAVVVSTVRGGSGDQANMLTSAGQTFTTGTLGTDNQLSSVVLVGPATVGVADPVGPFTVKLWTDIDGNAQTWDPGTEVAASTTTITIPPANGEVTASFTTGILADNTVYVLSFSDANGDHQSFRMGLTAGDNPLGTSGKLFHLGGNPSFGDNRELAFTVNAVPEPAAALLGGLGMLALLRRRRG